MDHPPAAHGGSTHTSSAALVHPDADALAGVRALYARSLNLQAYQAALALGPLERWRGAEARVLAGRLAYHLGSPRLGRAHLYRAHREHPDSWTVALDHARLLAMRQGPYQALERLHERGRPPPDAELECRSEWVALEGMLRAQLRDFERAQALLDEAGALDPDNPWLTVEYSRWFTLQDRFEEALSMLAALRERHPWHRAAVLGSAEMLQNLNRDAEALELLTEAMRHVESFAVADELLELLIEHERFDDAAVVLERHVALTPIADDGVRRLQAAHRFDICYGRGDVAAARECAREAGGGFYEAVGGNMDAAAEADPDVDEPVSEPVRVPVQFVRQLHMTCGPATLSAISAFFDREIAQPEIVDEIWFDGTTDLRERRWADGNGFLVREFKLTWEAAVALLDRGVPFAIATVETTSAHLQAVVGYDPRLRVLLLRDPTVRRTSMFLADKGLDYYQLTGPRAMLFLPPSQAHLIEGVELPEVGLHDLQFVLRDAIDRHDAATAQDALARLEARAPGHRLTLWCKRMVADYDGDEAQSLACTEALLEQFPDDPRLHLSKQWSLAMLGRRGERLEFLEQLCASPSADPGLVAALALLLLDDWREVRRAERLVLRLLRIRPADAEHYLMLGNLRWRERSFDKALELYRFAACLEDKKDRYLTTYFQAARMRNRAGEALAFLNALYKRYARKSAFATIGLAKALIDVDRDEDAERVLDNGLRARPEDGELALFAAGVHARKGSGARARALLERARGRAPQTRLLMTTAELADLEGRSEEALAACRAFLEIDPLDMNVCTTAARILAETRGPQAAVAFVDELIERLPHHRGLHHLRLDWLEDEPDPIVEAALDRLLELHPTDAWAWRELALLRARGGRFDEAMDAADHARTIAPQESVTHSVLGDIERQRGRLDAARALYEQAIRFDVDNEYAIGALVETSTTRAGKEAALEVVEHELVRQVVGGEGVLAFQRVAERVLEPDALLALLGDAHRARPDLWHAWSALGRQRLAAGDHRGACSLLGEAVERFPLQPRLRLDHALACRSAGDGKGERQAIRAALAISPSYALAARMLADTYERSSEFGEARSVVEHALVHAPLDGPLHGYLADYLWREGESEAALGRLRRALELEPGYEWAWDRLREWALELDRPELPADTARRLTERRPGEARGWRVLARMLDDVDERVAALDRAIAAEARSIAAHEERFEALLEARRYDDALAAIDDPVWRGEAPPEIRAFAPRVAWLRGETRAATADLETLLAEEPRFYEGWRMLADWRGELGEDGAYRDAALEMGRIAPDDARSHGYLGDALVRLGENAAAANALRQALALQPAYGFAGLLLLDVLFSLRSHEEARKVVANLSGNLDSDYLRAREARVAGALGDRARAVGCLETLCRTETEDRWVLDTAVTALDDAGWGDDVDAILSSALTAPGSARIVGNVWGERVSMAGRWSEEAERARSAFDSGPAGLAATAEYIESFAGYGNLEELRRFVRANEPAVRADAETWAAVALALRVRGWDEDAIEWTGDWHERDDLGGYALAQAALARWACHRVDDAAQVHARALAEIDDHTAAYHRAWLALAEGLRGDRERCAELVASVDPERELNDYLAVVHALARALAASLDAVSDSVVDGWLRVWCARRILRGTRKALGEHGDEMLHSLHRTSRWRIARRSVPAVLTPLAMAMLA